MDSSPHSAASTPTSSSGSGPSAGAPASVHSTACTPIRRVTPSETRLANSAGNRAEYCNMPTLTTSRLNTVAASGVPKSAVNSALMPHRTMRFMFRSSRRSRRPMAAESAPPICSAAPSRPALPPVRCVSAVPAKISAARRRRGFSPLRTLAMIWFVPLSFSMSSAR